MTTRWFCDRCRREWLHARGWSPEDGCPACHAAPASVRAITYRPAFVGADLPRRPDGMVVVDAIEPPVIAAPVATVVPLLLQAESLVEEEDACEAITG